MEDDILASAREQVLECGAPLDERQVLAVLGCPTNASTTRWRWRTRSGCAGAARRSRSRGSCRSRPGLPRGLPFLLAVGRFETPVRAVRLDIPALVRAAHETAATGATEFCLVAAVRGPDERLMAQVRDAVAAINAEVEINIACSLGILTRAQAEELAALGRAPLQPRPRDRPVLLPAGRHHPHLGGAMETLGWCASSAWRCAAAAIIGMGETVAQRAEFAAQLAALDPDEVPLNFLDPRPGTPFAELPVPSAATRCARSRRFAWRCRGPSCASPAAASSRSATSARARACSAASTP